MLGDEDLTRRSNSWWRVRQVAEEILASPEEDRDRILSSCSDDEELLAEVRILLEAAEQCDQKPRIQGERPKKIESNARGDRVGPYRLLKKIGEGGFGEVWMADQVEPVRRRIAIKLIKPGMDCGQVVARFDAERQALAMMDHPNIARVLDANSTDDGRPFFVMELVNGVPITDYCNTFMLGLQARVELMRVVCSAIQHAHQKGVIHRDLKPGNVLVGEVDGAPVVKVIDFGVAKALERPLTDEGICMEFGQFLGTPEYMSPEQADHSQIDVDTRSDVYALGVLLYELLVGAPPFEPRSLRSAGFEEMRRIIREVEPLAPSDRIGSSKTVVFEPAMNATRARRLLRGELDWIVQCAMAKDCDKRYPSAHDLNEDLGRYLNGAPVESGPPNLVYRLSRLGRRHRTGVGIAAVMLIVVLGFLVLLVSENSRAHTATLEARAVQAHALERALEAEHERAISAAIIQFLNDEILGSIEPSIQEEYGRDVSIREVLDVASERIDGAFEEEPEAEASVQMTIAQGYRALGLYNKAESHFERAHELWRGLLGTDAEAMISVLEGRASQAAHQGRMKLSHSLLQEAIDLRTKLDGPDHLDTLGARRNLMYLMKFEGRYGEAEGLLREIYSPIRRVLGIENQQTLDVMIDLAEMMRIQGRFAEASPIVHEVVAVSRRINGPDHDNTLLAVNMLAALYKKEGRLDEACDLLTNVLGVARVRLNSPTETTPGASERPGKNSQGSYVSGVYESRHMRLVAIQVNLGDIYRMQGRVDEATELLDEVLEIQRRNYGPKNIRTIKSLELCARIRLTGSRFQEAEALLEEAIAASRETLGDSHVQTAFLCTLWSETLLANCRVEEAVEQATIGLEVVTRARGDRHPKSQRAIRAAHDAYLLHGERDPSGQWIREADELQSRLKPVDILALDPPLDESSP